MPAYVSTFISGLGKPVEQLLREQVGDVRIRRVLDGLIEYETNAGPALLGRLRFVNNTFAILRSLQDSAKVRNPLGRLLCAAVEMADLETAAGPLLPAGKHGFRVFLSEENQLVSGDRNELRALEKRIEQIPGKSLTPTSHNPQVEFWLLHRREGVGYFLLRLTLPAQAKPHAGELRPELAHILCWLSQPQAQDIFLDPFSGYGAIPVERARSFPCRMVFAGDRDPDCRDYLRKRLNSKKLKKLVIPKTLDALDMKGFEDGFIDRIVTDPPWGFHEEIGDVRRFYSAMLKEFYRVLKAGGIIVLLTARKSEFEQSLSTAGNCFGLAEKHDILVSGQKAAIYKIRKPALGEKTP